MSILEQGGWLIWPILLASIVALGIVLERLWCLRRANIAPKHLLENPQALAMGSPSQAAEIERQGVLGRLLAQAMLAGPTQSQREAALVGQSANVVGYLERNLELLGVIAAVAPLMGLLGTVIGMIDVFGTLMLHGSGDASLLAGVIGQALVTTATGLLVAIPALIGHRLLSRRARSLMLDIEGACEQFLSVDPRFAADTRRAA